MAPYPPTGPYSLYAPSSKKVTRVTQQKLSPYLSDLHHLEISIGHCCLSYFLSLQQSQYHIWQTK